MLNAVMQCASWNIEDVSISHNISQGIMPSVQTFFCCHCGIHDSITSFYNQNVLKDNKTLACLPSMLLFCYLVASSFSPCTVYRWYKSCSKNWKVLIFILRDVWHFMINLFISVWNIVLYLDDNVWLISSSIAWNSFTCHRSFLIQNCTYIWKFPFSSPASNPRSSVYTWQPLSFIFQLQ